MPAAAHAQASASSFPELASLLETGETVSVANDAGKTVKGKVRQVSDTIVVLRSGRRDVPLAAPDVQRVARSRHRLREGALIGLAAGFTAGATWATSQPCDWTCFSSTGGVLTFGGLFGAIGMGVGAAVGASFRREDVVYERKASGRAHAEITPLPLGGTGLLVKIRW
jgi:hypothetical protein